MDLVNIIETNELETSLNKCHRNKLSREDAPNWIVYKAQLESKHTKSVQKMNTEAASGSIWYFDTRGESKTNFQNYCNGE